MIDRLPILHDPVVVAVDHMPKRTGRLVELRQATREDSDFLLKVRNMPAVVEASHSRRPIDPATHERWWATVMRGDIPVYIVSDTGYLDEGVEAWHEPEPLGYLRFSQSLDRTQATVSIALAPEARSSRIGSAILRAAWKDLAPIHQWRRLMAEVRVENAPSLIAFLRAGWRLVAVDPEGIAQFVWQA